LSNVFGAEKIAQIFEVFDSLTQTGRFGREFPQRRLVGCSALLIGFLPQ
jgi:hypothetical protein